MGADFICVLLPMCEKTTKRVRALRKCVEGLDIGGLEEVRAELDEDVEIEDLVGWVSEYWSLRDRRDVGIICLDTRDPRYLITGGMSWGDDPTDACPVMSKLGSIGKVCDMLLAWAKED